MKTALLLALLAPASLAAQQPDLAAIADTVFARWNSTHTPGCAVGVARGGEVLLTRGYGMADLESGTPITPETVLESGSVAKRFTATAVVLLALDGRLGLDDDVRRYIPELPEYGRIITIRHLLTHTSGLREWSSLVAVNGWPRGTRVHEQSDLLDFVFRQRVLNYPVGEYYSYTNSGYALAATLVERVSGMSFQEFSQQRIFAPLGMTHTRWRDDYTRLVPGRAQAYRLGDDGWHLLMPFENVVGPGGLLSTVGDWLIWNEALTNETLGAAVVDSLTRQMRLTGGRQIPYALGLIVTSYRGVREISHSGSTAGYSTFLARYPDRGDLSIAVMCNAANAGAGSYAHVLADRLIEDFPRPAPLDTAAVDASQFARYFGVYRNDRTHAPQGVDSSTVRRLRALPDGWFWSRGGARWHFELSPEGTPTALRIAQSDGDTLRFTFMVAERWSPSIEQLRDFEGTYHSDEVDVSYGVRLRGDSLVIVRRAGIAATLRPVYRDAFTAEDGTVWFTRDRRGRVAAAHFSDSRLWDLVMEKTGG
jgi:CubicO group peptidase (beta-lactamase class C family)